MKGKTKKSCKNIKDCLKSSDNIEGIKTLLLGLYFYPLQQPIFLLRFGRLNDSSGLLDIGGPTIVGICSVAMLKYFLGKARTRIQKKIILACFFAAVPFALIGSMAGGLLGFIGIIIYGLMPFALFLGAGHLISAKKFSKK